MNENAAKALGAAVIGVWGSLPRDVQEALFEAAVIAGPMDDEEAFREQLAHFLHNRHPRTAG